MKIFLTMISVLAFVWSCGSANTASGGGPLSLSFALGEISVTQEGATPIATDGVAVEDDNGIIDIPIVLGGLTNRDGVEVTVELTLAEGVIQLLPDDSNTEAEGVLTLTIPDPDGEGEVAVAREIGRFVVEWNSVQYNLIIAGAFAAQAIAPAPTTDEIVVTLAGSTPIIEYDDVLTYTVSGLTNSDSGVEGSISIGGYAPAGFTAVLGSDVLTDPDGAGFVALAPFTTITVTEDAYSANEVIYTISVGYASFANTPPPASAIIVTFPGSLSVENPGDTNLDVSFSDTTSTYTVAGLTNRSNEDVTFNTNAAFAVGPGYTITPITRSYTSTSDAAASSGAVELGTFTITDDSITGDTGTSYTISGTFAAQVSLPSDLTVADMTNIVTLDGSTISNISRGAVNTYTYTVEGLTNRASAAVTINADEVTLPPEFGFNPPEPTYNPDGIGSVATEDFLTFRIEETAYPSNGTTYIIKGAFAAQATLPTMETAEVTYNNDTFDIFAGTQSTLVYRGGTSNIAIRAEFTDAAAAFEYFDRGGSEDDGVIAPIATPGNVLNIVVTPKQVPLDTYETRYTIREKAYYPNAVNRTYIFRLRR